MLSLLISTLSVLLPVRNIERSTLQRSLLPVTRPEEVLLSLFYALSEMQVCQLQQEVSRSPFVPFELS